MSTMRITIKTLQQLTFNIEFDATQTVRQLKERIEEERGRDYPVDGQMLIYGGVVLDNDRTVESYNVEERKFIVLMQQKVKQATAKSEPATEATPATESSAELTKEAAKMSIGQSGSSADEGTVASAQPAAPVATTEETPVATTTSGSSVTAQQVAESRLLMGDEYNKMVENLVEMGYSHNQVHKALAASFNNPERAVEYLISGIPEDAVGVLDATIGGVGEDTDQPQIPEEGGGGGASTRGSSSDPLDFLRRQPQFHQMRSLIQQNPSFLHALLQQVGQSNPALLRLISENQETFVNMLNEPYEQDNSPSAAAARTLSSGLLAGVVGGATDTDRPAQADDSAASSELDRGVEASGNPAARVSAESNAFNLTPEDIAAIERLKELGFSEQEVIEAYLACGKNENIAANFLFS
ncbi:UV excision repair protein RAD23 [Sergentomyia squamirostris]